MESVRVDVVVIGAGMAGASVAAVLAERCNVVVLESERSASRHSTGRSAAAYLPSYGNPVVRALTLQSRPHFDDVAAATGIEILKPRPLLWLATDDHSVVELEASSASQSHLQTLTVDEAVHWCDALVADRVRAAALDASAHDIDVDALHQFYLAKVRRSRGVISLDDPVLEIASGSGTWSVRTATKKYECSAVVNAAGAWADDVAAIASVPEIGLRPKRRTIAQSSVQRHPVVSNWPLIIDSAERWYFKPEGAHLLFSPAEETDVPPSDVRPDDLEIARAIEDINQVTHFGIRSVSHSWAGLRSFVSDRGPVIGAWPEVPGFHFVAGQGGYGIQMAPALAQVAAEIILDGNISSGELTADVLAPTRLRQAAR